MVTGGSWNGLWTIDFFDCFGDIVLVVKSCCCTSSFFTLIAIFDFLCDVGRVLGEPSVDELPHLSWMVSTFGGVLDDMAIIAC